MVVAQADGTAPEVVESRPAPPREAASPFERRGSWVSVLAGGTLGVGSRGIATGLFVTGDVWVLPWLGVGADMMRGQSTELKLFADSGTSDRISATRGHASFRLALGPQRQPGFRGAVVTTFSLGPGRYEWDSYSTFPGSCNSDEECTSTKQGEGRSLSFGFQIGLFARVRFLALGIAFRVDVTGGQSANGISPQVGLAF
jgi:hypothetical protein